MKLNCEIKFPEKALKYLEALQGETDRLARLIDGILYIAELDESGAWRRPIVTQVSRFTGFYPAEKYHQDYFEKNPKRNVCHVRVPRFDTPLKAAK